MVDYLIKKTGNPNSGFYLNNYIDLIEKLSILEKSSKKLSEHKGLLQSQAIFPSDRARLENSTFLNEINTKIRRNFGR